MIWRMAWRNIWRQRRRTLITLSSVAFGLALTVLSFGLADYTYQRMINDSARMGFGHVTVQPQGYQDSPSLEKRIEGTGATLSEIRQVDGVDRAVARITGQGMFASARKTVGGSFIAVRPRDEDAQINLFIRAIDEGKMFDDPAGRGAVVGRELANKLNLSLGKKLILTAIDRDGEVVSELFRVSGVFETGVSEVDGGMALLPIDRVRQTLRYAAEDATMVSAYISQYRASDATRDRIAALVGEDTQEVATWRQTQRELASLSDIDRGMNYVFMALLGILIAAGVLNTALMSVLERRREFGMMMALGMKPRRLAQMVVAESLMIGTAGMLVGAMLCAPMAYYMINTGIDMSEMMPGSNAAGILIDPIMRLELYPPKMLLIAAAVVALTTAASLYPAINASRVPPVEAIKDVG